MLAHSINRGVSKNALARPNFPSVVSRSVANWGRRRWPRWRDDVADEEFKQLQLKMDAFHKQIEANPYETLFGRSNEMLRGILRTPLEPESPRKTVPISTDSAETKPRDDKAGRQQGAIELTFDPISGRMIPKYGSSTSSALEESSIHYSQTHVDPRDDALKAFDKKQTSTPTQSRDWLVQEGFTASSTPTKKPAASEMNEQEQLQDSLAKYDQRMREQPQTPPAPPSEWLVQEEHSRSAPRRPKLPENDVDLLTAADVRARMGIRRNPSKETAEQKQDKRAQLEQDFGKVQEWDLSSEFQETLARRKEADAIFERRMRLEAEYAAAEQAEHTRASEQKLSDILETSVSRNARKHLDDGYSRAPTGLQTSFAREKASGRDLATDIQARTEPVQYDDGYSREPMGLETSFEKEQASGRSLADEIQAKTDPKNYIVDDGYSREPMGLETSFERERASGRSLADEIKAKTDPKEHIFDDGYSREPTGLETSYQRELESGRSLEEEIQSRDNAHLTPLDDGYSREPTGLQSSYARELAATSYEREIEACKKGQRKSLEEELQDQSLGLETSFQREVDAHTNGKRKSLEEELAVPVDGGAVETMSTKEEAAKLKAAREQRLHDIALIREVRDIYEKYYGKITTTHRQAKDTSTVAEAATTVDAENEGRVDEDVHQSLSAYEEKNNGAYNFKPDNLEAELVAQNLSASSQRNESASKPSTEQKPVLPTASEAGSDNTIAGLPKAEEPSSFTASTKPRVYKLLAFDRTTQSVTTSQTSSTVYSSSEHPIPLSVALSNLAQPAKFISQLHSLQREGFEPVASTANLLVLRLRDDKAMKENTRRGPRPNPVDGTTIPLPPTPTMSPTGYINLDPVMENPAAMRRSSPRHKDDRKVRKTEPVFSGERSRKDGSKGQSVKTVLTTLIWATAACYVAGVAGEVAKGY
ncbi:hypothetical protein GTA08_BOTSDO03923 [Neofusicoccum parvum]|nr:hypothetical protein GTA08_BOTSDO03923 [Neofusicoccum parvum]